MPKGNKNLIESLRSAHDPHFKLEGRVEELEKKLPIEIADLHKTLSKSFGMQRKTLVRVLGLEKKIEELQAAKQKVEEVVDDIGEDKIKNVVEDIAEDKPDVISDVISDGKIDDIVDVVKDAPQDVIEEKVEDKVEEIEEKVEDKVEARLEVLEDKVENIEDKTPDKSQNPDISGIFDDDDKEEIPPELDDLIKDVQEEGETETKKPAATKKKPRKKPTARKIPKKKPVAKKKKISVEDLKKGTVMDPDFKSRVYGEDEEGEYLSGEERKIRFKKSKISADDIRGTKPVDTPPEPTSKDEGETEGLKGIRDVLDDILKVLRLDFKGDRKEARDSQKEAARKKRGKREDKLEGVGKAAGGIGKAISAMVKPFSSIWDIVMNFVKTVIIGVLLNKILKWFGNPKNQGKIKSLGKFFRDWWPALTTAALLFLTPLGGLVKGVVGLLTAIIPKLVMAIAANPWAAAAVLGGVAIYGIAKMAGGKKKEKPQKDAIPKEEIQETGNQVEMSGGGVVPISPYEEDGGGTYHYNEGGVARTFIQKYNQGGLVQHFKEGGEAVSPEGDYWAGRDTSHFGQTGYRTGQKYPEQFVFRDEKFKQHVITKGDEVIKDEETYTDIGGSIGMPDLIEHQTQLVEQIRKVPGYENINFMDVIQYPNDRGNLVGIKAETLYPILNKSDAGKATMAKRDAAMEMDRESNMEHLNPQRVTEKLGEMGHWKGGGPVRGFNTGGEVPGTGNKDTVPAMLTPGEFVMSKGAVNKYGTDTLENMNAAAGASAPSSKSSGDNEGTVPAMLTPGEFVVSAPAVQEYGTNTLESMNAMGGGTNKPEFKEPSVEVNNGGLISNYRNMKTNHYYTGGLVQYLQGGGEVNQPKGMMRFLAGAADHMTMGLTDFDKRGSMLDGAQRMGDKMAPGKPNVQQGENKTITLPTIPKEDQAQTRSNSDVPQFRINIESSQRSMVISSLGISDLMGG